MNLNNMLVDGFFFTIAIKKKFLFFKIWRIYNSDDLFIKFYYNLYEIIAYCYYTIGKVGTIVLNNIYFFIFFCVVLCCLQGLHIFKFRINIYSINLIQLNVSI